MLTCADVRMSKLVNVQEVRPAQLPSANVNHDPPAIVALVTRSGPTGDAPAFDGLCVYMKPKLLAKAPADVIAHAGRHPAFPHDPTSDQCFDEATFEAYRTLGFLAARSMLDDPTVALALTYSDATPIDGGRPLLR